MRIRDLLKNLSKSVDSEDQQVNMPDISVSRRDFLKASGMVSITAISPSLSMSLKSATKQAIYFNDLIDEFAVARTEYLAETKKILTMSNAATQNATRISSVNSLLSEARATTLTNLASNKEIHSWAQQALQTLPKEDVFSGITSDEYLQFINDCLTDTKQFIPNGIDPRFSSAEAIRDDLYRIASMTEEEHNAYFKEITKEYKSLLQDLEKAAQQRIKQIKDKAYQNLDGEIELSRKVSHPSKPYGYNLFIARNEGESLSAWRDRTKDIADIIDDLLGGNDFAIPHYIDKGGRIVLLTKEGSNADDFFTDMLTHKNYDQPYHPALEA